MPIKLFSNQFRIFDDILLRNSSREVSCNFFSTFKSVVENQKIRSVYLAGRLVFLCGRFERIPLILVMHVTVITLIAMNCLHVYVTEIDGTTIHLPREDQSVTNDVKCRYRVSISTNGVVTDISQQMSNGEVPWVKFWQFTRIQIRSWGVYRCWCACGA